VTPTFPIWKRTLRPTGYALRLALLGVLLALMPSPTVAWPAQVVARGDAAVRAGHFTEAFEAYREALAVRPGDTALIERLLLTARAAHRSEVAAAYLDLLAIRGEEPALLHRTATARSARGDREGAAPYWIASLDGSPTDVPALIRIAGDALAARDWEATRGWFERALTLEPGNADAAYALGLLLAPTAPRSALEVLARASADPRYAAGAAAIREELAVYAGASPTEHAFRIGLIMMNLQAWPYAERALSLALAEETITPAALAFLGLTQDHQGRDGWPALRRALDLAPNDALVNYAAGSHWRLRGDPEQALAALTLARALDPQNPAIAAELGLAYRDGGFVAEALLWLRVAVVLAPEDLGFRQLLAGVIADEQYDLSGQGLAALRDLAARSPDDAEIQAGLGWALLASGEPSAARTTLQEALRLDPANLRARFTFAVLLEYEGDLEGAVESYRFVVRQDAGGAFGVRAIRALERLGE
jgi:tetratricopeptide (TPR) repeat protein